MKSLKSTIKIRLNTEQLTRNKINKMIEELKEVIKPLNKKFNFIIISSKRYNLKSIQGEYFIEINRDINSEFPEIIQYEMDAKFSELIEYSFGKKPIIIYGDVGVLECHDYAL
jgi:hypothetical protein